MKLFDDYFRLRTLVLDYFGFNYFGYPEGWRRIPLEDSQLFYWRIDDGTGTVTFHESEEGLNDPKGDHLCEKIYTQNFNPKCYRGKDFTLICTDEGGDCGKMLRIFSNERERVLPSECEEEFL
jgi:hypothetical protein